ncbi:hypothetical protein R0J90_16630, partial [Micrococcus sp. SIMBA_144]
GTAIKRIQLYQDEQKRAENYLKLETLTRELWRHECADDLISAIVHRTGESFNWPLVGYFLKSKSNDVLHSIYKDGKLSVVNEDFSAETM